MEQIDPYVERLNEAITFEEEEIILYEADAEQVYTLAKEINTIFDEIRGIINE